MLEDRDYMRQPEYYYRPRLSCTVALLIAIGVAFVIQLVSLHFPNGAEIQDDYFALSLDGLKHGYLWQLLTFQFMHAGLLHILGNSLAIYFIGRPVEMALGRARFLALYFSSGVIGGLVQMLLAYLFPGTVGDAVIGASAGAMGLLAAFAALYWEQRFTMLLYFILPVTLSGKTLFWCSLAFTVICGLIPDTGIANAAHLGGILTGFFFVRQIVQGRWHWPQWKFPARREKPRAVVAARAGKNQFGNFHAETGGEDLSAEEFLRNEVDPILDKISAHGIQSLTARERQILEKARAKMSRR